MLFRVLDIETVPDYDVWTQSKSKWTARPSILKTHAPGIYAADREYPTGRSCGLVYEEEELFPPPQVNRVVAVAWCDVLLVNQADKPKTYDFQGFATHCLWRKPDDEVELLRVFRRAMTDAPATLVTWNGRGFDLPVLAMRALHHGIPWGWYYDERNIRYRYTDEGHCDLMDYLSDYGASRSMKLDDACRLVGLPGKAAGKGEAAEAIDGSKVADIVMANPENRVAMARVGRYCLQDVLQTALLFVRSRHHLEILDDVGYRASLASFSNSPAVKSAIDIEWDRVLQLGGRLI